MRPPISEKLGDDAVGEISGTFAGTVTEFRIASVSPLFTSPISTCMCSRSINCRAASTARAGCAWLSRTTSAAGQPSTPPAALIWSTASCAEASMAETTAANGPVTGITTPSFTGQVAAAAGSAASSTIAMIRRCSCTA